MLDLESTLVNEFLIKKLEGFACAFVKISLLYTTTNQNKRKFVESIVPTQD